MAGKSQKIVRVNKTGDIVEVTFIFQGREIIGIKRFTNLNITNEPLQHREYYYKKENLLVFQKVMQEELEYLREVERLKIRLEREAQNLTSS